MCSRERGSRQAWENTSSQGAQVSPRAPGTPAPSPHTSTHPTEHSTNFITPFCPSVRKIVHQGVRASWWLTHPGARCPVALSTPASCGGLQGWAPGAGRGRKRGLQEGCVRCRLCWKDGGLSCASCTCARRALPMPAACIWVCLHRKTAAKDGQPVFHAAINCRSPPQLCTACHPPCYPQP